MNLHIPTLLTSRLTLAPIENSHLDAYAAMYGSPIVMQHIGTPLTRVETWKLMARHAGHWVLRGFGGWTVLDRAGGTIVGLTGLQMPEGSVDIEIGWIFSPESWGRGYAPEAANAVLNYAFEAVGAMRVAARIDPANTGSIAVARKLGMCAYPEGSDEKTAVFLAYPKDAAASPPI